MENAVNSLFARKAADFRLPRYSELPDMGLYLEQVTKYINGCITPIGCAEITASMVSNYVKKGIISPPVKKQYYAEQIAYLLFISVSKSVLSIENLGSLIRLQQATYHTIVAYDYFCTEFENMLLYICGSEQAVRQIGVMNSEEKTLLRSIIIAVTHMLYVTACFEEARNGSQQ